MTTAATLAARLDRAAPIIRGEVPGSKRKERKARRAFSRTLALITASAYAEWINAQSSCTVFRMTTDAAHWAQSGVHTGADLATLLDGEHRREMRKAAYDYGDDFADEGETFGGYGDDDGEGYTFDRDRAEGIAAEKAKLAKIWEDVPF